MPEKRKTPESSRSAGVFCINPLKTPRRSTLFDFKPVVDLMKAMFDKYGIKTTLLSFAVLTVMITVPILAWRLPDILAALAGGN